MGQINNLIDGIQDIFAEAKRMLVTALGKWGVESGAHGTAGTMAGAATGGSAALGTAISPMVMGGFAAVSAIVNHMEYEHQREKIAHFYKDELAAKLRKISKPCAVDLDTLEKGNKACGIEPNHVVRKAIAKQRWIRNVGIGASFIASLATFALINAIVPSGGHVIGELASGAGDALATLARVAVSVLTYMAIKSPVATVANHLLGLDRDTAHDKIVSIARHRAKGRSVTKEQLVDVFIAGNPELAAHIEARFGRPYDDLALLDKANITRDLSEHLPIEQIQKNINAGITDASELAFTVQGDYSGVKPKPPEIQRQLSRFGKLSHKLEATGHKISQWLKKDPEQSVEADLQDVSRIAKDFVNNQQAQPAHVSYDDHNETHLSTHFVDGVKRRIDDSLSQTQRLLEARQAKIIAPSTQTIQ